MKAKIYSKSVVSLILTLLLLVSMVTIGIVNASSAKVDAADTGASTMEVYFTNNQNWGTVKLHYWGGSSASQWPGIDMPLKYTNDMGEKVHYVTIPRDSTGIIFNNGSDTQTVDISVSKDVEAFFCNGTYTNGKLNVTAWPTIPAASGGSSATEAPTAAPVTGEKTRLAIADDTTDRWLGNDNAQYKVIINGAATAMTKSVDVASGLNIWYADVAKINGGTAIKFQRCSAIDSAKVWNEFSTSYTAGYSLYKIGDNDAITPANMLEIPDGSVTNFGYGIWVDTKGNADTKDFVKIYATDFVKNTTYNLYLPSYTDWANLKVYTNFPTCTIDGKTVTKGQVNTLNLSTTGVERTVSISFKRNTAGSIHNGSLHIMRGNSASAMLMTTKLELYTGLTAAYAVKEDGTTPDYEGVAAYKSFVSTKGDYKFYDKTGTMLNPKDKTTGETLTGLKKVKARGNSTFEASMRLYGKTAYNVTLNDKAPLIEGCESAKKYSLLANNADESLVRNATVYGIADAVGMPYTPNTRLIDLYDNGTYLGAYVLTEKVEYGKNTLIPDAKSADKANEDILAVGKGIDYDALKQVKGTYKAKSGTTYTYQYSVASESGKNYEYDGSTVTVDGKEYTLDEAEMKKYDFLLEHEIETRYAVEGTWFRSNRTGQALVPKYPEFATKKQAEWMIEQYDALEDAAYDADYSRVNTVANVETFADVYLIQELTENLDAGATSYYILGGATYPKLLAAPLWDYDWAAGQYNGKKLTTTGSVDVADYNKVFAKVKSVKIDSSDSRTQSIPNLQAKLCSLSDFWTVCKKDWTNKFVPVLNNYLGDGKTLLGTTLPAYSTAANMNENRWGNLARNYTGAHSSDPAAGTWGTRSTITYVKGSKNFGIGQYYAPGSTQKYENAVYYLNDWLQARQSFMSSTMGLYDASMIETEPPTEAPTDPPTEKPTDPPTEAPTDPPTEPETQSPTTYDHRFEFKIGDVDDDEQITIMDATKIQQLIAGYENEDRVRMHLRGTIIDTQLSIMDATAIQRFVAGFNDSHNIGQIDEY